MCGEDAQDFLVKIGGGIKPYRGLSVEVEVKHSFSLVIWIL